MSWPGWGAVLTTWQPAWPIDAIVIIAAITYAIGLYRAGRAGIRWSRARVVAFAAGLIGLVVTFDSGVGVFSHPSFGVHMVMHLMLIMVVPALWVTGGPIELAGRVGPAPARSSGR